MKKSKLRYPKINILLIIAMLALFATLFRVLGKEGFRTIDYIQIPAFLSLGLLILLSKIISENFKINAVILIVAILGFGLLFTFGIVGNSLLVLSVLAMMILAHYGRRIARISFLVIALIIFAYGILVKKGIYNLDTQFLITYINSFNAWIMGTVGFLVSVFVIYYHFELIKGRYNKTLLEIKDSAKRYQDLFDESPICLMEQDFSGIETFMKESSILSNDDLDHLFTKDPSLLISLAKTIKMTNANSATVKLYQANSKKELLDNILLTMTEDSMSYIKDGILTILSGADSFTMETKAKTLKGENRYVIYRYTKRDTLANLLVSVEDITKAKQTENLLRIQHTLTHNLGNVKSLNDVYVELFKQALTIENIDSGGLYNVDPKSGDLKLAYSYGISEAFVRETAFYSADSSPAKIIKKGRSIIINYSEYPEELKTKAFKNEGIQLVNTVPVYHNKKMIAVINYGSHSAFDISEDQQNLLEAISSITGEVISRIGAESALTVSEEKLKQSEKMQAIGQLAGGIAHDFNNQLTPIMGYADLLKNKFKDDEKAVSYLDDILSSAHNASELITQLLAFARKGKYLDTPVDINKTINEVIRLLGRSIDKQIIVKQNLIKELCLTVGDPIQLQNVFLNLAINSRDAMPNGGEIIFETRIMEIDNEFSSKRSFEIKLGTYVEITVKDSGSGIDSNIIDNIFEPFFTTKELGKGTGMGLAAVYGTVKSHKGTIDVYSEVNKGTTIKVYLPIYVDKNEKITQEVEVKNLSKGSGHVLVVDDEPLIRLTSVAMLENLGYSVSSAKDGVEALKIYKENWKSIDLVILDMIMPEMSGKETFAELIKINPKIKALLSSGYSINEEAQEILKQGVQGFLQKPYRQQILAEKLNEILV